MSHACGRRGSCSAGDVAAIGVGSGALLGRFGLWRSDGAMCAPSKHATVRSVEHGRFFFFDRRRLCGCNLPLAWAVKRAPLFRTTEAASNEADRAKALWHAA